MMVVRSFQSLFLRHWVNTPAGDYLKGLVMKVDNDALLARQAQQGDREAFLTLYNRYLNKVYNRVKSRVPADDVEDVVQEIFIAAVRSIKSFEQRSQFNTWLYTIVNRQIADFYRKRQRRHFCDECRRLEQLEPYPTDQRLQRVPACLVAVRALRRGRFGERVAGSPFSRKSHPALRTHRDLGLQ